MKLRGPGGVPTFGNFLGELARANDLGALAISIQPVNKPGRHWSITDYPAYEPLTRVADPDAWVAVDLRPLRALAQAGLIRLTQEARETVFGCDLLLLIGGTDRGRATWKQKTDDQ
jgi:hypothetical protein